MCGEEGHSGCKAGASGCVIVCEEDRSTENGRAKDISSTGVLNDSREPDVPASEPVFLSVSFETTARESIEWPRPSLLLGRRGGDSAGGWDDSAGGWGASADG